MREFSISEMKEMQRQLQDKYKDKWEGVSPAVGKHQLLWMIGEIGEVIDIIKKNGITLWKIQRYGLTLWKKWRMC